MTAGKVKSIENTQKGPESSSTSRAFARQSSVDMSPGGFDAIMRADASTRPRSLSKRNSTQDQGEDSARPQYDKRVLGAGNQAIQRRLNTATENPRLVTDRPALMDFPHQGRISASVPLSMSLAARLDPDGCASRGALAYTQGTVSYFSGPHPDVHVAAHEATHQLQHAGMTRDAGLGAEGHAGAVADMVRAGRSAAALIGPRGNHVAPAERNYVITSEYGPQAKLGELGESLTYSNQVAYATPSLISQASAILQARHSGVSIAAGAETKTVKVPKGTETKILSRLMVKLDTDPTGENKASGDCRQCAGEVMGGGGPDKPQAAVINAGGSQVVVGQPDQPGDFVAKAFYVQKQIAKQTNYQSLPEEQKQQIVKKAESEYEDLSMLEKANLRKEYVEASNAKELGIDEHAKPAVGEAFAIFPANKPAGSGYKFHFATVIMAPGSDRITLENAGTERDQRNDKWDIETYGTEGKGESFQESWARTFRSHGGEGGYPHTLVIRNAPRAPEDIGTTAEKPTAAVMDLYRKSTNPDEKHYLKQVLDGRVVLGDITIEKQDDLTGDDNVYLEFASSGHRSTYASIPEGKSGRVSMWVGMLLPPTDPLIVHVYERDWLSRNDLIGTISWPAPYLPKTETIAGSDARYVVTLRL